MDIHILFLCLVLVMPSIWSVYATFLVHQFSKILEGSGRMIKPELAHLTSCDRLDFYGILNTPQIWLAENLFYGTHRHMCLINLLAEYKS